MNIRFLNRVLSECHPSCTVIANNDIVSILKEDACTRIYSVYITCKSDDAAYIRCHFRDSDSLITETIDFDFSQNCWV